MRLRSTLLAPVLLLIVGATSGSANLLINGDAETGDLTGWMDPSEGGFNLGTDEVPASHPPVQGMFTFWAGVTGPASGSWTNEIRQDVDVSSMASSIDAGDATSVFAGWGRTAESGSLQDAARIVVQYHDSGGGVLTTFDTGIILPANNWVEVGDSRTAPPGTRAIRVRLIGTRAVGASTDALFDALSLTVDEVVPTERGSWGRIKDLYR